MPTVDFTTPGNYTWTVPNYVSQITVTAIGGGGSGFSDDDGNFVGGGGGGGGMTKGTYSVTAGTIYALVVGPGGSVVTDGSREGGASSIPVLGIVAGGGRGGSQNRAGGVAQGGTGGQNYPGQPGVGEDDNYTGGRGGNSSCNADYAYRGGAGGAAGGGFSCGYIEVECSNFFGGDFYIARFSGRGGKGRNLDTSATGCPSNWDPSNGYGGGGGGTGNGTTSTTGYGGNGAIRIEYQFDPPTITQFYASPNPQQSSNGVRNYSTTINWVVTAATSYVLQSGTGESWNLTGNSYNITNLPQSVVGSNSPAQRTYQLFATGPGGTTASSVLTVSVYNDNFYSNTWNTSFTNLESSETNSDDVVVLIGTLSGVDMPTIISVSGDNNFISKSSTGGWGGEVTFANGDNVYLKTSRMPFNTDLSGVATNAVFGKTISKIVTVFTPSGSFNVTFTTRAPRIKEDFNYSDVLGKYPHEDIDLIANTPTEYTLTAQINADDIEIPMEVRVDNPDAQISINGGEWQNVRSI